MVNKSAGSKHSLIHHLSPKNMQITVQKYKDCRALDNQKDMIRLTTKVK